jgi:hypothetical protein
VGKRQTQHAQSLAAATDFVAEMQARGGGPGPTPVVSVTAKIEVGGCAALRSRTIPMTVEKIEGNKVTCVWHSSDGYPQRQTYLESSLDGMTRR